MKKTKFLLIFSILALFTTTIVSLNIQPKRSMTETFIYNPVIIHVGTISISANGDFATYASSGNGSASTPWIIENLVLNGNGSGYIFNIQNTDAHFIIRNCLLYNTTSTGIYCYQVGNGKFINNTITDVYTGIEIEDGTNFQIINNTIINNANNGVETNSGATYLLLYNNTLSYNGYAGVYFWGTNHSVITENTIKNNIEYGMVLDDTCRNNTIAFNTLNNNTNGLYITDDCNFNRIQYNTLNNNTGHGIHIYDRQSNYNTFLNNTANFNWDSGIYSYEASHNTFINNTANWNQFEGIYLDTNSFNYTLINNEVAHNSDCGFLIGCANNTLTYNRANNNTNHGIYLEEAHNSTLTLNTANGNTVYGIFLDTCNDTSVTWNVLHENAISVIQSGGSGNVVINNSAAAATLTGGSFAPAVGDIYTAFNFSVVYTDLDNLEPFSVRFIIDGTPHDMDKQNSGDNNYADGCTYNYMTTLAQGPHTFSFEAFDITYRVTTTQTAGPSVNGLPVAPDVDPILPNPSSDGIIILNWNNVDGASYYLIYRAQTPITSVTGLIPIGNVTVSNYQEILTSNGIYYYVIVAGNSSGESEISNCVSVVVELPGIPGFEIAFILMGLGILAGISIKKRLCYKHT